MKILRHKTSKTLFRYPFYLWLLGLYPILHLYSVNYGLVLDNEVSYLIVAMLISTTLIFHLARRVIHNPHKRAFFLAIWSLAFSLSGHAFVIVFMPRSLLVWSLGLGIAVLLLSAALYKTLPQRAYTQFSAPFNLIAVALLAMQLFTQISNTFADMEYARASAEYEQGRTPDTLVAKVADSPTRPDIYYIIPDAYPSDERLAQGMNFDNSRFTKALKQRGFVIAPHAHSNYAHTLMSLASILNMRYFDSNPSAYKGLDYLRLSIADSEVARQLQQLGYTYVQFVSGFVHASHVADINRDFSPGGAVDIEITGTVVSAEALNSRHAGISRVGTVDYPFKQPFTPLYIDTTALRILRSQLEKLRLASTLRPYARRAPERFLATIDEIPSIVAMPEATFTVVHLYKPHTPVDFDEHGTIIEPNYSPSPEDYFAELTYVNSKLLEAVDTILSGSKNPPVILLQADHGSIFGSTNHKEKQDLYGVLAAYYLPGAFALDFPKTYTLVNTFPLILNELFGTDHPFRENQLVDDHDYHSPFARQTITEFALR